MLTDNLLQFRRCSFRQEYEPAATKDVVDQIIVAVVCKLHFGDMSACISACLCCTFSTQNLLYMGHTQVSQFLLTCCHKASETTAPWRARPAKGSSLSTCCGAGCYKHLSNLKWVCNTVMFPSRCYLPAYGNVPCTQGVRTGWDTYTLSHPRTHTHTHVQKLENSERSWRKIEKRRKMWRGVQQGWGGGISVLSPDKVSSLCPERWLHKQHCWLVKQKEKALSHRWI